MNEVIVTGSEGHMAPIKLLTAEGMSRRGTEAGCRDRERVGETKAGGRTRTGGLGIEVTTQDTCREGQG